MRPGTLRQEENMSFNIAIDGPAGAGKSTIARQVAKKLGYIYVDTGAMYRAMAYYLLMQGVSPDDADETERVCEFADISIVYENGEQQVILNGENVTGYLRTEEVGNMASVSSANPAVRRKLVELQQRMAAVNDVVMDGRDIGTQVLPGAQVKIYLTAGARIRALRRYEELKKKGIQGDLEQIQSDIEQRDYRDMHREISPLVQAEDAVYLDTSHLSIPEVVEAVLKLCTERQNG